MRSLASSRALVVGILAASAVGLLLTVTPVGGMVVAPLRNELLSPASYVPQSPALINFQGRLTTPAGLPVADGSYSIAFRLYDVPTGGTALWTETQPSVAVSKGLFNVFLGSVTPIPSDAFAGTERYLDLQVGADPPMTPRQRFTSVPYALQANTAGTTNLLGFSLTAVDSTGGGGEVSQATWVTIGADGLPIISYYDLTNADLKVAKCGNAACSAGNTVTTVDSAGGVGRDSSITIGTDGVPVISYNDSTNGDLKVAKCGNAACSAGNTLTTVDSAGSVGYRTSIAIGADGLPVVSYQDTTNTDLKVAHCGNAACSSGNTLTAVDSAGVGAFPTSIAIGADGLPVISYQDGTNADLKVARCGNAACNTACGAGGTTCTTVDSAGLVGYYTSIAIGADGLPVISYLDDAPNGDLKVAKCGNAACSSGNTVTAVDTPGNVGGYTSITIGWDGLPVISYQDNTGGALRVARCGNAACSSGNTLTTVGTGIVPWYTSTTIGGDGLPIISYYDAASGALKVAHCSNRFCTPYVRPR